MESLRGACLVLVGASVVVSAVEAWASELSVEVLADKTADDAEEDSADASSVELSAALDDGSSFKKKKKC